MPHVFEPAASGRAKCRGCGERIVAGDWRFGEGRPNPYADDAGELTHWFHLRCGAYRRPEAFLAGLTAAGELLPERDRLREDADHSAAHRRLPRLSTVARAASGRANCRACHAVIVKNAWRIALVYDEDGRFVPSGFVHLPCAAGYFETDRLMDRIQHFSPALTPDDVQEIERLIAAAGPVGAAAP